MRALAVLVLIAAAVTTGCGGSGGSSTTSAGTTPSGAAKKPLKIAFMAGIVANPYTQATTAGMKQVAAQENASITVLDSQFNPDKQFAQFQDLIASKQYDGIVLLPLNGVALRPLVKRATDAGIKIGSTDLPIGPDNTTTAIQTPGVSVAVLRPFSVDGDNLGRLTVAACKGVDPCKVAFMFGVKASAFDQQEFKSFQAAIAGSKNVKIVAQIEGQYSRDGGLKAAQDLLQVHPDVNVLVGSDQSLLGAEPALKAAGSKVKLIGAGGTRQAVAAVRAGRWFGDAVHAPETEGKLVMRGIIDAIRTGKQSGGVDAVVVLGAPDDGRITAANADRFTPEYDG